MVCFHRQETSLTGVIGGVTPECGDPGVSSNAKIFRTTGHQYRSDRSTETSDAHLLCIKSADCLQSWQFNQAIVENLSAEQTFHGLPKKASSQPKKNGPRWGRISFSIVVPHAN
ncbi:hypothetical protein CGZ80_17745 [Rhodopirellula sp. MGV]|nr:hypothetical protein CGZ80_17745 [Rhodopirellula sp. MGV]